jgi:peptidoglycan/LPS O-acetylase OafA/YrhL
VLFGVFVVTPLGGGRWQPTASASLTMLANLIALRRTEPSGVFLDNPLPCAINGSLWSIPYEFKCYLALILLANFGLLRLYNLRMLGLFLFTIFLSVLYPFFSVSSLESGAFTAIAGSPLLWCRIFPYFLAGIAFYLSWSSFRFSRRLIAGMLILFALASMFPPAGHIFFPFAVTYLLFWFAFHPWVRFHGWARYGDFSYGIYLYAFPIQQLLVMRIPRIQPMVLFFFAAPLAVLAGIASWHLVEKHFLNIKNRIPDHNALNSPPTRI